MVLENDVVFGAVSSHTTHYEAAATALADADRGWLSRVITRRVPMADWEVALEPASDDVKVVVDIGP